MAGDTTDRTATTPCLGRRCGCRAGSSRIIAQRRSTVNRRSRRGGAGEPRDGHKGRTPGFAGGPASFVCGWTLAQFDLSCESVTQTEGRSYRPGARTTSSNTLQGHSQYATGVHAESLVTTRSDGASARFALRGLRVAMFTRSFRPSSKDVRPKLLMRRAATRAFAELVEAGFCPWW